MVHAAKGRTALLAAGALVFNALVWGVSWWPFRQLQGYGLHPLWATALMYLMIATGLLVLQFKSWRGFVACPQQWFCPLYTPDASADLQCVNIGGGCILKQATSFTNIHELSLHPAY